MKKIALILSLIPFSLSAGTVERTSQFDGVNTYRVALKFCETANENSCRIVRPVGVDVMDSGSVAKAFPEYTLIFANPGGTDDDAGNSGEVIRW